VVDPPDLGLRRYAYRRAIGVPEMTDAGFLDGLAQELKEQFASNADLRNESQLFYEFHPRVTSTAKEFDDKVVTTNDTSVCDAHSLAGRDRSHLARNVRREIEIIASELARIRPGWFRVDRRRDVPRSACTVGRCRDCFVWVDADGLEALTEFTLTILKFSSLVRETQTLIGPGNVTFSPGDRPG
jgi:hypothetical protein